MDKFSHPDTTAQGEQRAWVEPVNLETLWFNTGTLCNLKCVDCYIESSPTNDRLSFITVDDFIPFLNEVREQNWSTREIGFTGGEPFLNPQMMALVSECLKRQFNVLILTNAMAPMRKCHQQLLELQKHYPNKIHLRVSIDHYTEERHAEERGPRSWSETLSGLQWLEHNGFRPTVAGRMKWGDEEKQMRQGYDDLFAKLNVTLDAQNPAQLILFPEMDEKTEVPEITTKCWSILNKKPEDIMCASSRMVVKRKGESSPVVMACTLLPYENEFVMGKSLSTAFTPVKLNHPHCAKFCVLGGGSCSQS